MDEASFLPDIIAATTNIDSLDYRAMNLEMTSANAEMKVFKEGDTLETADFKVSDRTIRLKKRGRMITTSYDVLRFQRLDVVSIALKRIGSYLAQSLMADAVDVLINGDGGKNLPAYVRLQQTNIHMTILLIFGISLHRMSLTRFSHRPT